MGTRTVVSAVLGGREVGWAHDLGDPPVAVLQQVAGDDGGAAAVVGNHRIRAHRRIAAAHDHARTLLLEAQGLAPELAQIGRILDGAASQDQRVDPLAAQHLYILKLVLGVAERVAQDYQPAVRGGHLLDAGHDLREIGVGDVVQDHPHHTGRSAAQRLRMRVANVAQVVDDLLDLEPCDLRHRIAAVEHAGNGGGGDTGVAGHVADGDVGSAAPASGIGHRAAQDMTS